MLTTPRRLAALLSLATLALPPAAHAGEHGHHHHHHMAAPSSAAVSRSEAKLATPKVALKTQDGKAVALPEVIDDGRPVLLNFIYTTCTAICPPMTRIFAEVQDKLGAERARVRIVSVSIDPEEDTPRRLRDYARQFGAAEPWVFLTGSSAASETVQKAFNAYRPDKMGHTPVTFLRRAPGQPWVRLDGLAQAPQILAELRPMLAP
ncbi:MAG: SCO family protein [Zoogloea sp.]|uniref:SCO family protein n=1 Tax=Zoogloea sp. TaxID=49181 RepID=UPI0026360519|nr:SCO family protein [Zoogloea sp.]MDD3325691.1 SCO family protein [Zoogloea sp.]